MSKRFLKISEVAELLSTTRHTIHRHRRIDPRFPRSRKMTGGLRFSYKDIVFYIFYYSNDNDIDE